jgi:hypothetical protein
MNVSMEELKGEVIWNLFLQKCDDWGIDIPEDIQKENWFFNSISIAQEISYDLGFTDGVIAEKVRVKIPPEKEIDINPDDILFGINPDEYCDEEA